MFVRPSRHGRPNVSAMITATSAPVSARTRSRMSRAERSGSSGRSATQSASTFDWSTPAFAQTQP